MEDRRDINDQNRYERYLFGRPGARRAILEAGAKYNEQLRDARR